MRVQASMLFACVQPVVLRNPPEWAPSLISLSERWRPLLPTPLCPPPSLIGPGIALSAEVYGLLLRFKGQVEVLDLKHPPTCVLKTPPLNLLISWCLLTTLHILKVKVAPEGREGSWNNCCVLMRSSSQIIQKTEIWHPVPLLWERFTEGDETSGVFLWEFSRKSCRNVQFVFQTFFSVWNN